MAKKEKKISTGHPWDKLPDETNEKKTKKIRGAEQKLTAVIDTSGIDAPPMLVADQPLIRCMVRSVYDLQGIRIQMGNRITANFKSRLGMDLAKSEKEAAAQDKKVLERLRADYNRITDGIIADGGVIVADLPKQKKFQPYGIITTYAELVMVNQYMKILADEISHFTQLEKLLKGIPIWDEYLSKIDGVGAAAASVMISEINIFITKYVSSLWAYCGLDTVRVGVYKDAEGKDVTLAMTELRCVDPDTESYVTAKGNIPVTITDVGRSKKEWCLVDREYTAKDGTQKTRKSITYNPFLKTKMVGVLASSFLRAGGTIVDGVKMSHVRRLELAKKEGFTDITDENVVTLVIDFLIEKGHNVEVTASQYGKIYYDYKRRLEVHPKHVNKTNGHRHAMALRYMIKMFLMDYWLFHRKLEGLPTPPSWAEAKLGLVHGELSPGKFPGGVTSVEQIPGMSPDTDEG